MDKNKTAIVLIHEIYGINEHIKSMRKRFSGLGADVFCPDLLDTDPFPYTEEKKAYLYFMNHVGFESGAEQIGSTIRRLKRDYRRVGVLGFSVGATIAWLCSENRACDFAIGCYGSRIRHYADIKPLCPALLIFPAEEKSFDVQSLVKALENQHFGNLKIRSFPGSHGFIDRFSGHFHPESADRALQCIDRFLERAGRLPFSSE